MTHNTDRPDPAPPVWTYTTPPSQSAQHWRANRTKILLAIIGVVALCGGLLTWLATPSTAPPRAANESYEQKSSLADQPPTVILNALQPRTLYPTGYVPYDSSKRKDRPSSRPSDYDPDVRREYTSSPSGCEDDPTSFPGHDYDVKDRERYRGYPIMMKMYPTDDPGGNSSNIGFSVEVFPAKTPNQVYEWRQWFTKCENAQITVTETKFGEVINRSTYTRTPDRIIEAPRSAANAAFIKVRKLKGDKAKFQYLGGIRGMVVEVTCSEDNKAAGDALFQAVILRIQEI